MPSKPGVTLRPRMHTTRRLDVNELEINGVIDMGNCHVADSRAFLNTILPVESDIIEKQLIMLEQKGDVRLGRQAGKVGLHWTKFPKPEGEGGALQLYRPLVDLGNKLRTKSEKDGGLDGKWRELHSRAPQSGNEDACELRPMIGRTALTELKYLEEDRDEIIAKYNSILANAARKRKFGQDEELVKLRKVFQRLSAVWWMQLLVPVEIKDTGSEAEIIKAIMRLACYMRQILQKQLDRRFVIGLIKCGRKFSVWLCDRSGLSGMKDAIDYYENPKLFVQALIALNGFTPEQLGFDETMKVFSDERRVEIMPSYKRPCHRELEGDQLNVYFFQWIIEMTVDGKTEKYMTIKTLSVTGAENISGRATLYGKQYVIKQYWRAYDENNVDPILSESELHQVAGIGERLIAYEDLKITSVLDTTLIHIRKNLPSEAIPLVTPEKSRLLNRPVDHDILGFQTPVEAWLLSWNIHKLPLECRVPSRMLFSIWGFPLKFFKDRVELLTVMLHAVQEHHCFFFEKKLLHRNISPENILICPIWETDHYDFSNAKGSLINLDHSKVAKNYKEPVSYTHSDNKMKIFRDTAVMRKQQTVDAVYAHISDTLVNFSQRISYLEQSVGIRNGQPPHTCASLGWLDCRVRRPNFENRDSQKVIKTGTVPYMSAEILDPLSPISLHPLDVFHDAIHDMESFYWILLNFALTRESGNVKLLRNFGGVPGTQLLVNDIFTNDMTASGRIKAIYLRDFTKRMNDVIDQVDPYFDFLKPFLTRWWKTLQVGYHFRACEYETIHTHVMNILEEALEEARKLSSSERHAIAGIDRRKSAYEKLCDGSKGIVISSAEKKAKIEKSMETAVAKGDSGTPVGRSNGKGKEQAEGLTQLFHPS